MAVSPNTRTQLQATSDPHGVLELLQIDHASFASPVRVCNDTRDWTIGGVTYVALPFVCKLPNDARGENPRAQLQIDNVGRELTAAVLDGPDGPRALGVPELVIENGFYDYEHKYTAGQTLHVFPAELPPEITALCEAYAVKAHQVLGCHGTSRTDFRWDDEAGEDGLFVLETNTQPGMTPTSLAPEQAAACGIGFPDLCRWLVEDASCAR
jgi:hypothetical protein